MAFQIIFFGSSPFSVPVLEKLLASKQYTSITLVTTPDKPVGRGLKLTPNPVKVFAQKHDIAIYESHTELAAHLPSKNSNVVGLVAAYGKIIPQSVLDIFNGQIFNIHPSLLPKYRGASPLQQQILDGITETGVTIIQIDDQMDHGPIVAQQSDKILKSDTWITLGERLFALGTDMFLALGSDMTYTPQQHEAATYTKKFTREDGFVPWDMFQHPEKLFTKFRAFYPWPGVWSIDPTGKRAKLVSIDPIKVTLSD